MIDDTLTIRLAVGLAGDRYRKPLTQYATGLRLSAAETQESFRLVDAQTKTISFTDFLMVNAGESFKVALNGGTAADCAGLLLLSGAGTVVVSIPGSLGTIDFSSIHA